MPDFIVKTKKIFLLLGDIAILYLSLYLSLWLRYLSSPQTAGRWEDNLLSFSLVFAFWLIIFFINDFYDLKISYNNLKLFNLIAKCFIINAIAAVVIFYFASPLFASIKPQRILVIDLIVAFILIFAWRKFFYQFIQTGRIVNKVLIIGQSPLAHGLAKEINDRPQLGYKATVEPQLPDNLKNYCQTEGINILIISNELKNHSEDGKKIFACLSLGIDVYNINGFFEQITGTIPVEFIDHSWFLENLAENSKKSYEIIKRGLDVILAIVGLIVTAIFIPIIALIIKLESPGPVIFKQIRTGKNGKPFLAMKFRSMVADAEKNGAQWAQKNDPRITRFGRLMRKTRIDEIPQLINILRGEMSFVGPRPERPEFIEVLTREIPFYQERLLVKPGLAGWAQLKGPSYGGSKEESLEKLKYDLYYVKNRSLFLDLTIILKTIRIVLGGKGQ